MNDYDSEVMEGVLLDEGYKTAPSEKEADVIILNTCSVRKHAEDRALSYACKYMKSKKVIITGCMAQRMKGDILRKYPGIYAVAGTSHFTDIADIMRSGRGTVRAGRREDSHRPGVRKVNGVKGYLAIMRGCNNFCTYCIVPYVRGRERSRPAGEIISELEDMAQKGCREVTLLGQNVNSYRDENTGFPGLLKKAAGVEGIKRIRFMTSHPKDLSPSLVKTIAAEEKICGHIHLPVQSGSDRILKLMNRGYTCGEFEQKAGMIRSMVTDASVTTDILVGFPGEREEDFEKTAEFIRKIKFDDAFVFKYSKREGTKAAELEDSVPEETKLRRLNYILDLQKKISDDINKSYLNREFDVLGLGKSLKDAGELKTTTDNNKKVYVKAGEDMKGKVFRVKITQIRGRSFGGKII